MKCTTLWLIVLVLSNLWGLQACAQTTSNELPLEIVPRLGHADGVTSIVFSGKSELMLSGGSDSKLKLWDAATGRLLRTFFCHSWYVTSAVFSPDATLLEAGATDAEVSAITGQSREMVTHYSRQVNQRKLAAAAILKWEAADEE